MKRILSLGLVAAMAVSAMPMAYATTAHTNGTQVQHVGEKTTIDDEGKITHKAEYLITVPAKMAPGDSCHVKAEGTWPSNYSLSVTADPNVTVTNNINNNDTKVLDIAFNGIVLPGNNNVAVANYGNENPGEPIAVADISNALFGIWNGTFYYNVELNEEKVLTPALYAEDGSVIKTWEELVADGSVVVVGDSLDYISISEGYKLLVPGTIKHYTLKTYNEDYDTLSHLGFKVLEFQSGLETVTCNMYDSEDNLEKIILPDTVTKISGRTDDNGYAHVFDNYWITIVFKGVEYDTYDDWATFNMLPECEYDKNYEAWHCEEPECLDCEKQKAEATGPIHFT